MTTLVRSSLAETRRSPQGLSAWQALWVLTRLYVRRMANRVAQRRGRSENRRPVAAKRAVWTLGRHLLFSAVGPLALSLQACKVLENLAQAHGSEGAFGISIVVSSVTICAMLLVGAFSCARDPDEEAEAAWLSMLPVSAWLPFACKLFERGLVHPYGWLMLFPQFTGLAAYGGWGYFAPIVAMGLCVPVFLLAGLVSGVGQSLDRRFSKSRWFRVVSWLAPTAATLLLLGAFLGGLLNVVEHLHIVGVSNGVAGVSRGLGFASDLRWLPFAEPARFLLARGAPAEALGWLGAFCAEVGAAMALCAWGLRRLYSAEASSRGRSMGARSTCRPFIGKAPKAWGQSPSVAALRKEWLWQKRNPSRAAAVALSVVLGNCAAIFLVGEEPTSLARPAQALVCLGALFVLKLGARLEWDRPGLRLLLLLPRSISWSIAKQATIAGAMAMLCALPAALVTWSRLPAPAIASSGPLLFGALSVIALTYLQAALWMRHARPDSATSARRLLLSAVQTTAVAAALAAYAFWASARQYWHGDAIIGILLLAGFWRSSVVRLEHTLDPSASRERPLELNHAATVILAMALAQPMVVGSAAGYLARSQGHLSPHQQFLAVQVATAITGLLAISWIRIRRVYGSWATLGFGRGKGLRVIVRQSIAWSLVATCSTQLWLRVFPPPEISGGFVLAARPWLLVGLLCVVVPFFEELLFRGFVYRTLRKGWGWLPSALFSGAVFAVVHPVEHLVPIFVLGVCAAATFERARSIAAPMLMHALYNGVVIAIERAK